MEPLDIKHIEHAGQMIRTYEKNRMADIASKVACPVCLKVSPARKTMFFCSNTCERYMDDSLKKVREFLNVPPSTNLRYLQKKINAFLDLKCVMEEKHASLAVEVKMFQDVQGNNHKTRKEAEDASKNFLMWTDLEEEFRNSQDFHRNMFGAIVNNAGRLYKILKKYMLK